MKINITMSLDKEVVESLKEENNYSNLVNDQLKAYYDVKGCQNLAILIQNLAKTKQILKETNKKRRELDLKIKKIKQTESKILKITNKYPPQVLSILKGSTNLAILRELYRTKDPRMSYLKKYNWLELKQMFNYLKGGGE